jgi:2-aminoadipate transaminase
MDGSGGSSMRLNFSGVPEESIREGIRRIGEVVREQVALYGTLTGAAPSVAEPAPATEPTADPGLADVLHLRPQGTRDRRSDAR